MTVRRAVVASAAWIGIAIAVGFAIALTRGRDDALAYAAAYLTEESLSLDNMVVFMAVFARFGVPADYRARVLAWGVIGAMVMRGLAIYAGAELLDHMSWIRYVFGALLVIAAVRMIRGPESGDAGGRISRFAGRLFPVTDTYHGDAFFWRTNGRLYATPLFLALVTIELSDIVFATDSIPAVFAVTRDPFLVYTSNILAVLGLRSLYFIVAAVVPRLQYIRYGLVAILVFVGAKMIIADVVEIPTAMSLAVIGVAIGTTVIASLLRHNPTVTDGL